MIIFHPCSDFTHHRNPRCLDMMLSITFITHTNGIVNPSKIHFYKLLLCIIKSIVIELPSTSSAPPPMEMSRMSRYARDTDDSDMNPIPPQY